MNAKVMSRFILCIVGLVIVMTTCSNTRPTIKQMYDEILCNEIKFPEVVLAQSINECGWDYGSYNSVKRNNFFGMTGGKKNESNQYGYKIFNHWTESVYDYKLWQDRNYKGELDYLYFLKKIGYASSNNYNTDLKWILREMVRRGLIDSCGL